MKNISLLLLVVSLFLACESGLSPAQSKLLKEIENLEQQLLQVTDANKSKEYALLLIEKTVQYAKDYPQDERTPTLLFNAGEVAKKVREYGKAVELWGQVWRDYAKHPKAPMALFLQGSTFGSILNDPAMATKYYKKFLATYPNDTALTEQVKKLLSAVKTEPRLIIENTVTE